MGWKEIDAKRLLLRFVKISAFVATLHKGKLFKGVSRNVREVQWLFGNGFCRTGSIHPKTSANDYNKSIELRPIDDMELIYSIVQGDMSYKLHKVTRGLSWGYEKTHAQPVVKHDDGFTNIFEKYDKILQLNPDDAGTRYIKGILLNYLERYEEAIELNESVKVHANSALASAAWHNQGGILEELERYEEALEAYSRAVTLSAGDIYLAAVGWHNRGRMYDRLKRYEEAIDAYDKAVALNKNFIEAWYEKATILESLNRYDEAIYAYDKSINSRPYRFIFSSFFDSACIAKTHLCEDLNRYEESLETLYKLIVLWGNRHEIRIYREGPLLEKLERYEEALEAYDQAINACVGKHRDYIADIAEAGYKKACIHSIRGNKADVLEELSNVIKINADYKDKAQKDEAFKIFWDDEDFKRIVM